MRVPVSYNALKAQLLDRGFTNSGIREEGLEVWKLGDEPYTLPMAIEKIDAYGRVVEQRPEDAYYCPMAISYFYDHVYDREPSIAYISSNGEKDYKVVPLPKKKQSD